MANLMIAVHRQCANPICTDNATHVAFHRRNGLNAYCFQHAQDAADDDQPEYILACENCGCIQGVN